jgi:hypothetical protein
VTTSGRGAARRAKPLELLGQKPLELLGQKPLELLGQKPLELLGPNPLTPPVRSANDRRPSLVNAANLEPHRGMAETTNRARAAADAAGAAAVAADADAAKKAAKKAATGRCQGVSMANRLPTAGPPTRKTSAAWTSRVTGG